MAQTTGSAPGDRCQAVPERGHRKREKSYFIKMGIRLICLILAFTVPAPLPVRLLLFAGAIFLPYVAVIGANAPQKGPSRGSDMEDSGQSEIPRHRREIGS